MFYSIVYRYASHSYTGSALLLCLHACDSNSHSAFPGCDRFVVYQGIQCYPEFLIYYERVTDDVHDDKTGVVERAEGSGTDRDEGNTTGTALSEAESLELQVKYLEQQLIQQRERHAIATAKQKQLKEDLAEGKKQLLKLEYRSRKAGSNTLCCGPQEKERSLSRRLSVKYINYEGFPDQAFE